MGFYIAGGILLLLILLMRLSVAADVRYADELSLSVGICGYRYPLLPAKEEEKPEAPPKKAAHAAKKGGKRRKKPEPPPEKPEKGDLKGTVETVWALLKAALPPIGELLCKVRLVRLDAVVTVGGADDAAEAAIAYGRLCALFYGGYAALQNMLRVKAKRVELNCDFLAPATTQDISFTLKLRVGSILWAALRIAFRFLAHTIRKERPQENA